MTEEQIKEVMRLADEIADYAWKEGLSDGAYSNAKQDRECRAESRTELEAYLRTIGEPENAFPLNPNAASKWTRLKNLYEAEAIGVVFRTGGRSVGSLVDGRVVWADWLAHPNGSKPAGNDLRWAAGVIEKYDDATIEACYMIDSTDCAAILTALAEYRERFDSPTPKHSEPESVNAELLEALKSAKNGLEWYQDAHPESDSECDDEAMQEIDAAIARAESAIETPAKVGQCAGHAVQQEADLCQIVGIKADGSETVLGSGVMPPTMKARELLHNYGFDPSDDNGEGGYAMAAVEELIDWMKKVGWQAPALISVKQDANEAGGA